jgi:hypothetical protein
MKNENFRKTNGVYEKQMEEYQKMSRTEQMENY